MEQFDKRLEFSVFLDNNVVVKRTFTVPNYLRESLHTYNSYDKSDFYNPCGDILSGKKKMTFNMVMDWCVEKIKNDLSFKSVCWLFPPKNGQIDEDLLVDESTLPNLQAYASTIEVRLTDVGERRVVYSRLIDASQYHPAVLSRIDLTNKSVRLIDKENNVTYKDKETIFNNPNTRMTPDLQMQKIMIWNRPDVLSMCLSRIISECSCGDNEADADGVNTIVTFKEDDMETKYQTSLARVRKKENSYWIKKFQNVQPSK